MNTRKDDEEVFKRRLLYDGHGTGDDKRLLNIMKAITRLCLGNESGEELVDIMNILNKDLKSSLNSIDRMERLSTTYDHTYANMEQATKAEENEIKSIQSQLLDMQLELEYVERLKRVNEYPDCQTTEQAIKEINRKKELTLAKMAKLKANIKLILDGSTSLQKAYEEMNNDLDLLVQPKGDGQIVASDDR